MRFQGFNCYPVPACILVGLVVVLEVWISLTDAWVLTVLFIGLVFFAKRVLRYRQIYYFGSKSQILLSTVSVTLFTLYCHFSLRLPLHVLLKECLAILFAHRSLSSDTHLDIGTESAFLVLFRLNWSSTFLEQSLSFLPQSFILRNMRSTSW